MRILVVDSMPPAMWHGEEVTIRWMLEAAAESLAEPLEIVSIGMSPNSLGLFDAAIFSPDDAPETVSGETNILVVQVTKSPEYEMTTFSEAHNSKPDWLWVFHENRGAGAVAIAEWLTDHVVFLLSVEQQRMVEVLVQELRQKLDRGDYDRELREDVATLTASVQTIEAQLRAPRPHRKILGWAFDQLPGFVAGSLSNVPGAYLVKLTEWVF